MKPASAGWPVIVTIAVALALGLFAMNPLPFGAFHDDARYLLLARSLALGTGYRFVFLPGAPAGTHFPPAFPLLLAALWKIAPVFPANVALFKLLNAALLPLAALATFAFARRIGGLAPWVAAGVAMVFAGSVPVLFLDGVLFSEPLFTACLMGALLVAERVALPEGDGGGTTPRNALPALAAGVAIGVVTMIRTIGIAPGVGLVLVLVMKRRWRALALTAVGIAVLAVPWQLWTMRHGAEIPSILSGDYGTYGSWVGAALRTDGAGFLARVVRANVGGFAIILSLFGDFGTPGAMRALVALPLLVATAVGAVRLARRAPVSAASVAVYLLVVLVWPGTPDRFLWPVWPVLLTALASGASWIVRWRPTSPAHGVARGAMLLSLAACALLFARFQAGQYRSRAWEGPARGNARMAIAATETAARLPEGLVASEFDAMVSLYDARPAVPLLPLLAADYLRNRTPQEAARQLSEILNAYHPRFLLVGSGEALAAANLLAHAAPPRLRLDGVSPEGVFVYVPNTP